MKTHAQFQRFAIVPSTRRGDFATRIRARRADSPSVFDAANHEYVYTLNTLLAFPYVATITRPAALATKICF